MLRSKPLTAATSSPPATFLMETSLPAGKWLESSNRLLRFVGAKRWTLRAGFGRILARRSTSGCLRPQAALPTARARVLCGYRPSGSPAATLIHSRHSDFVDCETRAIRIFLSIAPTDRPAPVIQRPAAPHRYHRSRSNLRHSRRLAPAAPIDYLRGCNKTRRAAFRPRACCLQLGVL